MTFAPQTVSRSAGANIPTPADVRPPPMPPRAASPNLPRLRDRRDRALLALTGLHAAVLAMAPPWPVLGALLWWNANVLSHQHVHRRLFYSRHHDALFSAWLSLLLGLPQRWWRAQHLAHHAQTRARVRFEAGFGAELALVALLWGGLAALAPAFLWSSYLPGFAFGLGLCGVHGFFEHHGGTTSCYGRVWNLLFCNDGYHVEHHAHPQLPSADLPHVREPAARASRWPPVLRWLDLRPLDLLERALLRWPALRAPVLAAHRRALRRVLGDVDASRIRDVLIVGGGLYPRTAILLAELLPHAQLTVLDGDPEHLARARPLLPNRVHARCGTYRPGAQLACDLAVLPLALRGARAHAYAVPPAPLLLVHDWLWRPRGESAVVAWWLGKRVNLVRTGTLGMTAPAAVAS